MNELEPQRRPKGRPRLSDLDRLTEFYKFRMSPKTLGNLHSHARSAGLHEAEWLRQTIDEAVPPALSNSAAADPQLIFELSQIAMQLRKLGVNANQIAHRLNAGSDYRPGWDELASQIEVTLAEARGVLAMVLEAMDE